MIKLNSVICLSRISLINFLKMYFALFFSVDSVIWHYIFFVHPPEHLICTEIVILYDRVKNKNSFLAFVNILCCYNYNIIITIFILIYSILFIMFLHIELIFRQISVDWCRNKNAFWVGFL